MIELEDLSDETLNMMVAAMPELRDFIRAHSDCSSIQFGSTKVHCADCDINGALPDGAFHTPLVVYGGARAALKRFREGRPHKQRHRKKMRDGLAALGSVVKKL